MEGLVVARAQYQHPKPGRRSFEQRHVTLALLMSAHQLDRLGRRHPERGAGLGERGDATVVQLAADRHP
jgi:hypothetical protein